MDMKRHLKSALKQLGFDKPRKAQIIPMNTLDAEQDAIVIAATGSGKQVIYETVGLAHSDKLTIVIEPLLALIYNQVQTLQDHGVSADYIDMTRSKEDIDKILNKARKGKLNFLYVTPERLQSHSFIEAMQHLSLACWPCSARFRSPAMTTRPCSRTSTATAGCPTACCRFSPRC